MSSLGTIRKLIMSVDVKTNVRYNKTTLEQKRKVRAGREPFLKILELMDLYLQNISQKNCIWKMKYQLNENKLGTHKYIKKKNLKKKTFSSIWIGGCWA